MSTTVDPTAVCESKLKRTRMSWLIMSIVLGVLLVIFMILFFVYLYKYRGAIAPAVPAAPVPIMVGGPPA